MVTLVAARMGSPLQTVYAGTKAALEGICKVWASELGKKYGITVNCVSPGYANFSQHFVFLFGQLSMASLFKCLRNSETLSFPGKQS
jgi:NAD(P)-dependent dehydrogenase (short-subunit alcohol dehydrogenase family)